MNKVNINQQTSDNYLKIIKKKVVRSCNSNESNRFARVNLLILNYFFSLILSNNLTHLRFAKILMVKRVFILCQIKSRREKNVRSRKKRVLTFWMRVFFLSSIKHIMDCKIKVDKVMQFICWLIDRLTLISIWFPLLCGKFPCCQCSEYGFLTTLNDCARLCPGSWLCASRRTNERKE